MSRVPKTLRPLRDLPLIGRDDDLKWLLETEGDRLLVGQPGIGKTFLCQELVNRELALFAIEDDIHHLADAIRDQGPTVVIIEDAHLRSDIIEKLIHYREEAGAQFSILADCWPGESGAVRTTLGIGESNCRELKRLSQKYIVELLEAANICGPDWLLHQLVRQSMGCPGLAAMLANACRGANDNIREAWEGRALAAWVEATFTRIVGQHATRVLAAFAIGGASGMTIDGVVSVLGYARGDIQQDMANMAFGGVVQDLGQSTLSVLPEPLRAILVYDYFFRYPAHMEWETFLSAAPHLGSVCRVLIGAKVRAHQSRHISSWRYCSKHMTTAPGRISYGVIAAMRSLFWNTILKWLLASLCRSSIGYHRR